MCDETTDVAVVKEVIIYARYLNSNRGVCTAFIGLMEVSDGTAKTILAALQNLCEQQHLDIENKLVAFGSDGAAVMIGARKAEMPMVDFEPLCCSSPSPCCSSGSR